MRSFLSVATILACVQAQHIFEPDRYRHELNSMPQPINRLGGFQLVPVDEPGVPYPVYELRPYDPPTQPERPVP